ncbi:Transcriptional regulator GlxA family, contains an amidase domain and an AraC-type DNA-binding HTH domain [Mucilaginibacter mallensis]|uniref:Transcriptional regulator GlxA family, contains an amidase domain and an AraC-type DNA-binding HTH domain n=1 Tax=Mucilaginibacter mallensis TaxID=652787 RepID=A0A1H1XVC4_MUCMA|nr:GlxA family transcriptional regulator [Mucilaginibacter mallensis]SDT13210.1 Transcriptional regulator GlxA family, contains an amidase domain and an AraC-type DNA-binding HTH domain [Mucilaginibacter mallensis]
MNHERSESDCQSKKKQVVIVAMSGNTLLNFAGPADVFTFANKCLSSSTDGYDVIVASPTSNKKVNTSSGLEIHCQSCVMDITTPIDTLIIAGNDFVELSNPTNNGFYQWLSKLTEQNTRRIGSVCGGAFSLAKAGLLNGKKATTHWDLSERLKKAYPLVHVDSNAFFMNDGNIYTSGGVSSGIDLALALVEEDYGKDIAITVARKLVFYLSRPGFQTQFGNLLPIYESSNIAERLKSWFTEHLHEPLDLARIADHLNMSRRNFTRVFHKQTGISPAKFIEKLRVETARKYLEDTDIPLERIAELCGLGNLISMRRTFLRHLMTTPSYYRRTFRTALKDNGIEELLRTNLTGAMNSV